MDYVETKVGSLEPHKFQPLTETDPAFQALPDTAKGNTSWGYVIEVYVDDYMAIAIPACKEHLRHLSTGVMTGVHDIFPPSDDPAEDSISVKKLRKGEGVWALQKELLGFEFDGSPGKHTLWLAEEKRDAILATMKGWLRGSRRAGLGVPFEDFESVTAKIRHTFTSIPAGKGLLLPLNRVV